MDDPEDTKRPGRGIELVAMQVARSKTNVAKWGLNTAVFLFGILIIIIILISLGIGTTTVAIVAIVGLAGIWFMGWRRGGKLFQRYYMEELSSLRNKSGGGEAEGSMVQLAPREIQILDYAAQGYSNKRIASELNISENTVKNLISRILSKVNANDRTEAVVIAIKNGLISIK